MNTIMAMRELFDLGVSIDLGDDEITVTGRDCRELHDPTGENSYIETVHKFPRESTIEEICNSLKEKRSAPSSNHD